MKILVTGGHLAPAIAVIEELKKTRPDAEIFFAGRKYALDSEKTVSLEYREIQTLKIPFIPVQAGRLTRVLTIKSIRNFLRIPLGFINSFFIVNNTRPDVILSFGSYIALPIVFWGYIFRIPVMTHEQTVKPGLANRIIGKMSRKVFVAFPEAAAFFNAKKTVVCGNPVREAVFKTVDRPFEIKKDRPVIYITGGSLGSHSINLHVIKLLKKLLEKYTVIHQCGDTKEYADFEKLTELRAALPANLSDRYFVRRHFFENEIGYIYSKTDLVVGRSGANTFFELLRLAKPAILIPLPWSAGREQQMHAEIFAKNRIGEIFHQIETSDKLYRMIESMMANLGYYRNNFKKIDPVYKNDSTRLLVSEILKLA